MHPTPSSTQLPTPGQGTVRDPGQAGVTQLVLLAIACMSGCFSLMMMTVERTAPVASLIVTGGLMVAPAGWRAVMRRLPRPEALRAPALNGSAAYGAVAPRTGCAKAHPHPHRERHNQYELAGPTGP
jgi:hypothetical protein